MDYILDKNKLYDLVHSFHSITNIKVVILDKDFNDIVSVPEEECAFCDKIHRSPEAFKLCMACEKENGLISKERNTLNIYKCHIGLTEAISPIKIGNIHIGYIMLGQIIDADEKTINKEKIISCAEKYTKIDMSKYYDSI